MANALAGYQRVVAEKEICEEIAGDVKGWWKLSEELVDGVERDLSGREFQMDPAEHKSMMDDLAIRLGGIAPEVGRDMSIPREAFVQLCFRDMMDGEINTWIEDTTKQLEFRRRYANKVPVPITSPEWGRAFSEYVKSTQSNESGDELSMRRAARSAELNSEALSEDFGILDSDELDAQFARSCFVVIDGEKQENDKP